MTTADPTLFGLMQRLSKIGQANYPEIQHKYYVINAPGFFIFFWNMIKVWINEKTREKFKIMGSNFKEVLLQDIDAD